MPLSEERLNTIREIFLESLNEHFPETVRFTEVQVSNACTRCADEYVRVTAFYESENPELNPRLMLTRHMVTDPKLAAAGITVSVVVTYTPVKDPTR